MTSTEVSKIVFEEIKFKFDLSNIYGIDLTKALITPIQQEYKSANGEFIIFKLWTVLEEAEDGMGYKIFYDDEEKSFGLGMKSEKDELIYLANYGSFLDTLRGM